MKTRRMEEMTWPDFYGAVGRDDLVVLPVAGLVQHGPYAPLGADCLLVEALAEAAGERTGALVAPLLPLSCADEFQDFPGSVSVDGDILQAAVVEICEGFIAYGARRFLILNGYRGNVPALRRAAVRLREAHGAVVAVSDWWSPLQRQFPEALAHAGGLETSLLLALAPDLVGISGCPTQQGQDDGLTYRDGYRFRGIPMDLNLPVRAVFPAGGGDFSPAQADRALGERLLETLAEHCAGLVREIRKIHPERGAPSWR